MTMTLLHWCTLMGAGLVCGVMNSAAGGGSFVAFPVLLMLGNPAIDANATATVAMFPGTLSAIIAYRQELLAQSQKVPKIILISLLGGGIGSAALLLMSNAGFSKLVPFLLLLATLFFTLRPALMRWVESSSLIDHTGPRFMLFTWAVFLAICIYGGFFGAGMGIMLLAALGLMGMHHLHKMNALRSLAGLCSNIIALIVFSMAGFVNWPHALIMGTGAVVGAYVSGRYFIKRPVEWMRLVILVIAWAMTGYFFLRLFLRLY